MLEGHDVAEALTTREPPSAEDAAAEARWRAAHEVRSLLDTLSIYRRCVVDLAAENTRLRKEVAVLRVIAQVKPRRV